MHDPPESRNYKDKGDNKSGKGAISELSLEM